MEGIFIPDRRPHTEIHYKITAGSVISCDFFSATKVLHYKITAGSVIGCDFAFYNTRKYPQPKEDPSKIFLEGSSSGYAAKFLTI